MERYLKSVLDCLKEVKVGLITEEYTLQTIIQDALNSNGLSHQKEFKLGSGCRVDFMMQHGIAIEIKKGKPVKANVIKQLHRYASFDSVNTIILVVERNMDVPNTINGKECLSVGLNKNWGIAL